MRFKPRFSGSRMEKKKRKKARDGFQKRKTWKSDSNMARNSELGCAWECVRVLDCASKAYFSPTSDIATASSL